MNSYGKNQPRTDKQQTFTEYLTSLKISAEKQKAINQKLKEQEGELEYGS